MQSLYECQRPKCATEVIVVINHSENASDEAKRQNETTLYDAQLWISTHCDSRLQFHLIYMPNIPDKIAGVGFARKTGMDEAVHRFGQTSVDSGVIVGFDADSECDSNYLVELERAFFDGRNINGASIYYEHPVEGTQYDAQIYEAALQYELHLRYLNQALRHARFPYAYHTVGSSFAVRAEAYVKQGGMNKRKAAEDFHFLQKIIPLGNYIEINTTRVIPSPRASDRVPFGTGASIGRQIDHRATSLHTYPLCPFDDLKQLFATIPSLYRQTPDEIQQSCAQLPAPLQAYLKQNNHIAHITQTASNSSSPGAFTKRFFGWFDGLKTVQYLNESCRTTYTKLPPTQAAAILLNRMGRDSNHTPRQLLDIYREWRIENWADDRISIPH